MKRLSTIMMCMFAMIAASLSAKAQEITITLRPGWNWIGYPNAITMELSDAFGDFMPMDGDVVKSEFAFAEYLNGNWAGSLTHFIPGKGYMYCSMRTEETSFVFRTPQSQVLVTTAEPLLITTVSIMCGGEVTTNDGTYILMKGLCWAAHENPTTNNDFYQEVGSGVGSFSISMTGLNIGTTYYVRAYAVTPYGTVYGNQKSFTTRDGIPEVTTDSVTNILGNGAICFGTVTDNGGLDIVARGFCWGTEPNPTIEGSHTTEEPELGSFISSLTDLTPDTVYYVRAYATTEYATSYGEEITFTTLNGIPEVSTDSVTNILGNGATCFGTVTDGGGLDIIARGFCWDTEPNLTIEGSHTTEDPEIGSFSSIMTGLMPNTTYYMRAYATTTQATSYGEELTFTTMSGIPQVSTAEVIDNTGNTATSGGTVTSDGGLGITARGVCWSTTHNPTLSNSHTTDGTGMGSFSSSLTGLSANTIYYVRAYATNSYVTMYGNEVSFTTLEHAYVDLGLPSGLLWATCNMGADSPEDFGTYYAWGETQPKDTYNWGNYQYCNGSSSELTKYCSNSSYGYNGFTDNLTILLPEDDAATVNWGGNWRIPTKEEWQELYDNTSQTWTTQNGVYGSLFIASNGDSLFLPAAGNYDESNLTYSDSHGFYWSSSLDTDLSRNAWRFEINSDGYNMRGYYRYYGRSVRAVRSMSQNNSYIINVIANPTAGGLVSGGGYYEEDIECTITATANEGYTFENWTENDTVVSTEATYTFTVNTNRSLVANFYHPSWNNGILPGQFSVSSGQQVHFSQGNLQYIGSANTPYWKFAENQWDCIGSAQDGAGQGKDRDLFGWGTSGWNNGNYYYRPWDTSWDNEGRYRGFGYGPYNGTGTYFNLTGSYANSDWGVYNSISNGGNHTVQWRTLSGNEWNYVFNTRTTTSGIRYAKANVNDVNGVILLPDDWDANYCLSNTNSSNASFSSNILTASQWSVLEQAGAVFLPAAGQRYPYDLSQGLTAYVSNVGSNGNYWSTSSTQITVRTLYRGAKVLSFSDSMLNSDASAIYLNMGYSVRLVHNVQ